MVIESTRPLIAMLISLSAVALIGLSHRRPNLREFWTLLAATAKFLVIVSMLPLILQGTSIECLLLSILPGLELKFKVDSLGIIFALIANGLWVMTSLYSIGYLRAELMSNQTRYYMCFAVALWSATGIAFSANLFTMLVFYEILTLSTYPLVAHKQDSESKQGAQKYLAYLLGTSIFFLPPAIFLTYFYTGTLDFTSQGIIAGHASNKAIMILFVLFIAGLAKTALMPFHSWLPAAMVAPSPVSALLHAVAVVKAGVFALIRVVLYVFGVDLLQDLGLGVMLVYLASFTVLAASIAALRQDRLKLRLAYSTISQLAYIVLGVALLTPSGIIGSIMHIVVHAFGKITLFLGAGAIYVVTHKMYISQMNGLGRQMPLTMGAFSLAAISMIGIPPFGGFISKWYLGLGAIEAGQLPVIIILFISSLLNAAYFLPIIYAAFFKEASPTEDGVTSDTHSQSKTAGKPLFTAAALGIVDRSSFSWNDPTLSETKPFNEAPISMLLPMLLTAAGVVVLFFWPNLFISLAEMVVSSVMG